MMAKVKGGKASVEFFGTAEILQKLKTAGANVAQCCENALRESVQKPKQEMLDFVAAHRFSGATEKSFVENIETNGDTISCEIGFDAKKGGLAAIFLNLGTPHTEPTHFIDKAVDNNIDEIKKAQENALKKAFKGL